MPDKGTRSNLNPAASLPLLVLAILLLMAAPALAVNCSDPPYFGVIDGSRVAPPSQIQIDTNCTIRNFPAPNVLPTNFSFYTQPGGNPERWLVVFDNVVHTGNMSCNNVLGHRIWFTNGSSTTIQEGCQNLLIPVEKIDKRNPAGQSTATVGVPFTYTLTMPVLYDPATGAVINSSGSLNDLHGVTLIDDLKATGADLIYLSHRAYWQGTGTPVAHSFSNVDGLLTFSNFPIVPAGEQIVIEITVVLADTPANAPGTQFINTAKWEFGRLIGGVFYEPLPGEWGITLPMTIAAPELVVTKTGPATMGSTINLGEWGEFSLDVQNTGLGDAWGVTLRDRLPNGAAGGMCDLQPEVLGAQLTDGFSSRSLSAGTDYSVSYLGAPACELSLTLAEATGPIKAGERLLLRYRTKLDADSRHGATLTNVAGAVRWFNGDSRHAERLTFARTLTDGTAGTLDHQDAHTVAVALSGYFFEKTVVNLTTGQSPATVAAPGDRLRYSLRLQTTADGLADFVFFDELDALNTPAAFEPGTLTVVSPLPAGAVNRSNPRGGAKRTGVVDIGNLSLPAWSQLLIQFDITVASIAPDGAIVANQSQLFVNGARFTASDDPNRNGQSDPFVVGDEDPTRLTIHYPRPPMPPQKSIVPARSEATIGEEVTYRIVVPGAPSTTVLENVVVSDTLDPALSFVEATAMIGGVPLPSFSTTRNGQILSWSLGTIPLGQQVVITLTSRVADLPAVNAGDTFTNAASYTWTGGSSGPGAATPAITVVEPALVPAKSVSPAPPATPIPGDTLTYTIMLAAPAGANTSAAFDVSALDTLSLGLRYKPGTTRINGAAAADPAVGGGDGTSEQQTLAWTGFDLPAGTTHTITYEVEVLSGVRPFQKLSNGVVVQWTSLDGGIDGERTYTATAAAPELVVALQTVLVAQKSVANLTTGASGANAAPGDRLRYTITIENTSAVPLSGFSLVDGLDRLNAAPLFQPGSIANVTPAGADFTIEGNTLTFNNLQIGARESLTFSFEALLAPIIDSGTVVLNQGGLVVTGTVFGQTDDPSVPGALDPTRTLIASAPVLEVWKTSADLTGDPAVLMAGETLRYTITVKNVGNEDARDLRLRDYIPANTTYVPNSTTLNGVALADSSPGVSPLAAGLPVNAPQDTARGFLPADAAGAYAATVTFEVVIDPTVMDGLVIENQGFVEGSGIGSGPFPLQPSDDPATPVLLDPTRDIVGNLPLLGARKTVQIYQDFGSPGLVDPGDVLRYTIRVDNLGPIPATGTVLTDDVPAETTYLADSLRLNGAPVGADGGSFPLAAGLALQSADAPGAGSVSPGGSAEVTFEVRVNAGVPAGTVISNQGSVAAKELPPMLTDADGLPANGYQPTVIVVGDAQLLSITKEVLVVGGGAATAGGQLEYVLRVSNPGRVPATRVVVTDDLAPLTSRAVYVAGSGTMNGSPVGISFAGSTLTADYAAIYGDLPAGSVAVVRFRVQIDLAVPIGTTIGNTGVVSWSDPAQTASATATIDLGGTPGSASLSGSAWHDADLDKLQDSGERPLNGWSVQLYRSGRPVAGVFTDTGGAWRLGGLVPDAGTAETYEVFFRAPGAGATTASLGHADSVFTNGPQRISGIRVAAGGSATGLNLPITPNGAVYNSVARTPVVGARVDLLAAATGATLPAACFDDPLQQGQLTGGDGFYKFDLNFGDPACPPGAAYLIAVTPPAAGYRPAPSQIIPPASSAATPPFAVPACPGSSVDAVPASMEVCEATTYPWIPPAAVAPRTAGTNYQLHVTLDDSRLPGGSQLFNNPLPLDPEMAAAVAISKSSALRDVSRGQLVPYTIVVNNVFGVPLYDVAIVDRFPAGFKYVEGSARLDGEAREPRLAGRELRWDGLFLEVDGRRTLQLLLVVGAGVGEGEHVNRAQVINSASGGAISGEAAATVRVVPDATFDCTDVVGKVFDDRNRDGRQDDGEDGLSGVRLVTARGLVATTDAYGRFHLSCAAVPDEERGSNFILKLDDRSLPTGYRLTTENPRVQRATRGRMLRFNFGATIHRVVSLDLADGVFTPDGSALRPQWRPKVGELLEELKKGPAVLRLSYLADVEREALVRRRLEALKEAIAGEWQRASGGYRLTIETEVFWRRGAPPDR